MAKQNHAWRLVAAAMAEPDDAAARRHLDILANPPTAPVVAIADLPEAAELRAAQARAASGSL